MESPASTLKTIEVDTRDAEFDQGFAQFKAEWYPRDAIEDEEFLDCTHGGGRAETMSFSEMKGRQIAPLGPGSVKRGQMTFAGSQSGRQ